MEENVESMVGNYEERKVGRYKEDKIMIISTAEVHDGKLPYETAISHMFYRCGYWVIVEAYSTLEEAKEGHEKWIETMTAKYIPEKLEDCGNTEHDHGHTFKKKGEEND